MDRIHVLLRDNAFNMKAGICILESSTAPCFIHTFQLINKDSLFSENIISSVNNLKNITMLLKNV